ncbi:MAG: glycosyltransferase family 39 protein, partial [Pseudomonadota bacterium]
MRSAGKALAQVHGAEAAASTDPSSPDPDARLDPDATARQAAPDRLETWAAQFGLPIVAVLALGLIAGTFLAAPGLFTIDEVIYWLDATSLAQTGDLTVTNGTGMPAHEAFGLWLLVIGPHGLVPQYPVGSALAGAPLVAALGVQGLILLNAIAAAATLFFTHRLARAITQAEWPALVAVLILCLASFFVEYAWGVWPHAITTACVTAALLTGHWAISADGRAAVGWALLCGLAVGIGFLFRVDSILALPALAAAGLLYARAPFACAIGGAVGLAPALAVSMAFAWVKFGSLNPLSYGQTDGGGTTPATYLSLAALLAALLGLLILARQIAWQPRFLAAFGLGLAGLLATAYLAPLPLLSDLAHGVHALIFDMTVVQDPRAGVVAHANGTMSFWGLWKKALGQSLPWIGLLVVLALRPGPARLRPALRLLAIACVVWSLPFAMRAWHGGLGSNMRYLLPVLPALSILAVLALQRLPPATVRAGTLAIWGALGFLTALVWSRLAPSGWAGAHQILPLYAFLAMIAAGIWAGISGRSIPARLTFAASLGIAAFLGPYADLATAQARRMAIEQRNAVYAEILPARSLFIGPPEYALAQLARRESSVALPDRLSG